MDELVRWLGEQLDEDERIVRAAAEPEKWVELNRAPQLSWSVEYWADPDRAAVVAEGSSAYPVVVTTEGMDEADAEARVVHVVKWDPERVLREIDAKRRVLAEVVPEIDGMDDRIDGEWGVGDPAERASATLLRLFALPYADRPGYREEWRA